MAKAKPSAKKAPAAKATKAKKNIMEKPCKRTDQIRDPVTHRCRKVAQKKAMV